MRTITTLALATTALIGLGATTASASHPLEAARRDRQGARHRARVHRLGPTASTPT